MLCMLQPAASLVHHMLCTGELGTASALHMLIPSSLGLAHSVPAAPVHSEAASGELPGLSMICGPLISPNKATPSYCTRGEGGCRPGPCLINCLPLLLSELSDHVSM